MAVYGYMRVSTVGQLDNTSLAEQRRKIQAVAAFNDWVVEANYEDKAISGSVPLHERPQGYLLLAALKPGDVIIASKLDRMFRSAEDALTRVNQLAGLGVDLILADLGTEPVGKGAIGKLFLTMLAAMAEFERARITERMIGGRMAKKAAGGYAGGAVPFGYTVVGSGKGAIIAPHPEKFKIRTEIIAHRRRGLSLREIKDRIEAKYNIRLSLKVVWRVCNLSRVAEISPKGIA